MAITQTTSQTGRFGYGTINSSVNFSVTGWDVTVRKEFSPSTDSNNYDPVTKQTWTSQQPGVVGADGMVEGFFDIGGVIDTNFIQSFKTDGPYPMLLGISRTQNFISSNWDFSDVKVSVKVDGAVMVTFTANCKTNGVPVLY
jgi:hypothetical protein